jgi:hypothetical protein
MPASGPPEWGADDSDAVPVGPEPEPTGVAGRGSGPGGWGGEAKLEPFAIAAMVWAIVSIVLPIVGTIVAFVLAARAADSIRRSRGTRTGTNLVVAARVVAGSVIALWAIGLIAFVAFGNDDDNGNNVAVPTQPPNTSTTLVPTTSTTIPPTTTSTTLAPTTTAVTVAPPVVITDPPPTTPPTQPTTPPTQPTTPPTQPTTPPTTPTSTTPPTTTSPQQRLTARIEARIGESNRGVPADERVVVQYTPGATVTVTWAINNGTGTLPTGEPTCSSPPTPPTSTTTTTTTTTVGPPPEETSTTTTTTTVVPPADEPTVKQARTEARQILQVIRNELRQHKIDATGVQLVGTYPISGPDDGDVDVVQVFYWGDELAEKPLPNASKVFVAPPAAEVQCLNPAFE